MRVGVIGGTGLADLGDEPTSAADSEATPYGKTSEIPRRFAGIPNAVFLNRHGDGHALPPHAINYRANLWLLNDLGVEAVFAVFAVGGIDRSLADGDLVVPTQIVDYTWGREHTFVEPGKVLHVDFSDPFDTALRDKLNGIAARHGIATRDGVYGCTQGPRFETVAEIDRMDRDGCTVVGMTAMPEAALARELDLPYVGICVVVNPAAGRGGERLDIADMRAVVARTQTRLRPLVVEFLESLDEDE